MYRLTGVTKRYPRGKQAVLALNDVDLTIEAGSQLVIQGPTGGGKSTLLQLLGGLDRATSGVVELDGTDLTSLPEARLTRLRAERIGFVFQSFNLIPTLTAQENVESALVPLAAKGSVRRERAVAALESVGLGDRRGHLPGELSGGQQQRVAIARALVKEPSVLLADEPTGNLDEAMRDEVMEVLEQRWKELGLTLVMVTHDSALADRAERLATIRKGEVTLSAGKGARSAKTTRPSRTERPAPTGAPAPSVEPPASSVEHPVTDKPSAADKPSATGEGSGPAATAAPGEMGSGPAAAGKGRGPAAAGEDVPVV